MALRELQHVRGTAMVCRTSKLATSLVIAGCALLAGAVHGAEPAIAPGAIVRVKQGPAPVKSGYDTLATLDTGAQLTVLDVRENWVRVSVDKDGKKITGWVHARYLSVEDAAKEHEPVAKVPVPGRAKAQEDPWRVYTECGNTSSLVIDETRNCIWFTAEGTVGKVDMATDEVSLIWGGDKLDVFSVGEIAVEGNHLWFAGTRASGLGMYDIPTQSLSVYTVANTKQDEALGLPWDKVYGITAAKDQVWFCSYHYTRCPPQLTRFRYREREHRARWTTFTTAEGMKKGRGDKDGLLGAIETIVPCENRYLLFYGKAQFQEFDPQKGIFETFSLWPPKAAKVNMRTDRGDTGEIPPRTGSLGGAKFGALEASKIWFFTTGAVPEKWKSGQSALFGGWPEPLLVSYDRSDNNLIVFSAGSTQSRPGANDGFLPFPWEGEFSLEGNMCLDGQDVWCSSKRGLWRYRREVKEATHYDCTAYQMIPTKDSIWMATGGGVARFHKSERFPKIVASQPPDGDKNAKAKGKVSVTFDLPMNAKTVRPDTVELFVNGALFTGGVSYDDQHNQLTYDTGKGLPGGMPCELILKSLVQAANGNPLRWTRIRFTTAD